MEERISYDADIALEAAGGSSTTGRVGAYSSTGQTGTYSSTGIVVTP